MTALSRAGIGPVPGNDRIVTSEMEVGMLKLSARNALKGKVKSVKPGVVNAEVVVELPGGQEIVSVITLASAEGLGLKEGAEVYVVIKASNVIIGVD